MTAHFSERVQQLSQTVDGRLNEISGKVAERLDEGFKKTNETFTSVMSRLAVIDEAQKKIEGLASNVVSLQEICWATSARAAPSARSSWKRWCGTACRPTPMPSSTR
jgi:DNA recombination protein RmuC